ncbi:general secretion pathway protein GspE [Deltaproteobacteria bacterium IMCC39524]|nr:general secretion pathway protein GspE [Deltaproteobacteria bacterium IMCC39524]
MAEKLGELLIKKNLLTQAQLEEALQAQVIFGGKLGTVLIEMGLITEDILAEILGQLINIPCAKPGQLQNIPDNVIKIISPELAEKHKVMPVSVIGKKLTLAMADPRNLQSIDEISFRTGYIVMPILALEVRLVFALENYYGVKRTMRYIAPPKQVREELNQLHVLETADGPIEARDTDEELGTLGSEHIYEKPAAEPAQPVAAPEVVEDEIEELDDDDLIEELEDEEITLATTAQTLIGITDRNDVADAVIAYLGANYSRAALFMVVAGQVTGWRSAKGGQPIPGFEQFQLPLSEPSVLKTAVESNSFFLGPVPQSGANLALTTFLGKPAPQSALLMPMSMLGRVVGLIYVDDPKADLSLAVVDVQQLSSKALMAFEVLILHNKILRV